MKLSRRMVSVAIAVAGLFYLVATVVRSRPGPGLSGAGLVVSVTLALVVTGWLLVVLRRRRSWIPGMALLLGPGVILHVTSPRAEAWIPMAVVVMWLIQRCPPRMGLPLALVAVAGYALAVPRQAIAYATVGGWALLAGWVFRQDRLAREQAERLLAEAQLTKAAQARSAVLAERARITREIHDVLAHTLSAQIVHLESARLLLQRGSDPVQVLERVDKAQRMARKGLAETREALSALRGELSPAPELLADLARDFGAELAVEGDPRELPADVGLAVYRTAQEALTNARKHAPGAQVRITLRYPPERCELEIRNGRAAADPAVPLTATGTGYGLVGMRERAELLGGTLEVGPHEDGFRVLLSVPVKEAGEPA